MSITETINKIHLHPNQDPVFNAVKHSAFSEEEVLEKYAAATNTKLVRRLEDLDQKVKPAREMLEWCKSQGNIIVLNNNNILAADPTSRTVQNCKVVMAQNGLKPGRVFPTQRSLILLLLENSLPTADSSEDVSTQQQRLRTLVKEALREKCSDIHIEVRSEIAKIRFRRHGELYLQAEWLPKLAREIVSVAFNKETDHSVTHFNPLTPQNASMPLNIDGHDIRLRIASMPAHGGFDVVLRILSVSDTQIPNLNQLGYTAVQRKLLEKVLQVPHGAVIISGPTGSGKTTTLAACTSLIQSDRKVYTIEDPVEKVVTSTTQIPVNGEQFDRTFASMGRATLRMDPDVMVLGEMRDLETASLLVRAAITGHLIFSTLHTNSATGIITRLVDLGISRDLLADPNVLTCLVSQRLVPILCDKCAVPLMNSEMHKKHLPHWQEVFGKNTTKLLARHKGNYNCPICKGLGIKDRTVVAEIIWIDEASRNFILHNDMIGWEKYLKTNGWTTLKDHAMELVKNNLCDPLDAEKIVGNLTNIQHFKYN